MPARNIHARVHLHIHKHTNSLSLARAQEPVNYFFTTVFTLELALNLYGHGVGPFMADA